MNFDIEQVIGDMANAISGIMGTGAVEITVLVKEILDAERKSLEELAEARLRGEIDEAVFNHEIEREKKVVKAELLTIEIMTKALAQKSVNAAIEVFVKAVRAAI